MRVISPTTGKTVLGLAKVMGRFNLVYFLPGERPPKIGKNMIFLA